MNAARRARQKANHRLALETAGREHPLHIQRPNPKHPNGSPLPVLCLVCRPLPRVHVMHGDGEKWRQ